MERQLELGEVRTIRSNSGKSLNNVELLFSPTTIATFNVNRTKNVVELTIDNTDLKYQDLNCALSKSVIRDMYMYMRDLYNELEESEAK